MAKPATINIHIRLLIIGNFYAVDKNPRFSGEEAERRGKYTICTWTIVQGSEAKVYIELSRELLIYAALAKIIK